MIFNQEAINAIQDDNNQSIEFTILIESKNNPQIALTTSEQNILINNIEYAHCASINKISLSSLNISNDVIDLSIPYDNYNDRISLIDANVTIKIYYKSDNLEQSITIYRGFVMQFEKSDLLIALKIASISQRLYKTYGTLFSPLCKATLGDNKCQKDLTEMSVSGVITNFNAKNGFIGSHVKKQNGYFKFGIVEFNSGKLVGQKFNIHDNVDNAIFLMQNINNKLSIGGQYTLYPGCDKKLTTCKSKFNNVVNFRGEPFINQYKD